MSLTTLTIPRAALVQLPNRLSGLRLALVPGLLGLAWLGQPSLFVGVLALSLATDVLDGFLARRLDACTEAGSRLDSRADLATWLALPICALGLRPELVASEAGFLAAGLVAALGTTALGYRKFGRLTSYHTLGAKTSAVLLGGALFPFFGLGATLPLRLAIVVLVVSQVEELLITRTLSRWHRDVPTLRHARALERAAGGRAGDPEDVGGPEGPASARRAHAGSAPTRSV
jgi:phosphatidylglycerophosphate synthase